MIDTEEEVVLNSEYFINEIRYDHLHNPTMGYTAGHTHIKCLLEKLDRLEKELAEAKKSQDLPK